MVTKSDIDMIESLTNEKKFFDSGCNVAGALACMTKEEAYRLWGADYLDIAEIKDAIAFNMLMGRTGDFSDRYDREKLKRIGEYEKQKREEKNNVIQ